MGNAKSTDKSTQNEEPSDDPNKPECCKTKKTVALSRFAPTFAKMKKKAKSRVCAKTLFGIIAVLTMIIAFATIIVTASTAFATKVYSTELSGRLVAMVILAVTAGLALCIAIYALVGVCTGKTKPLFASAFVLIVLAIIQSIIAGIAVDVTPSDELTISASLADSFKLAKQDNPRHLRIWATTQSDLDCCGVYSPEDYRTGILPIIFPPDVPISCCPTYDPNKSALVQERERETCKARKEFYDMGCKTLVIEVFRESASIVLGILIPLIIFEVLLAIVGGLLSRKKKQKAEAVKSDEEQATGSAGSDPPK